MDLPSSTLVFDTETTGLPLFKEPYTHPQQPHITQLGALLLDRTWNPVSEINVLIQPDGWTIPEEVVKVTGITTEACVMYGFPLEWALRIFTRMAQQAELIIGHNSKFDELLVEANNHRAAQPPLAVWKKRRCTMATMTPICKLPGRFGYKWPKLQEAHKFCFGHEFENAHDAMADVRATARVANWCFKNDIILL